VAWCGARNGSIIEPIKLMPFDMVYVFFRKPYRFGGAFLALFFRFVVWAL